MRLHLTAFAACALALGIGSCGTGGGSAPQQSQPRASSTPTSNATPTAAPTPTATPIGPPTPAFNNWPTYGYDNARDGYNPNSGNITPASLSALHLAWEVEVPELRTQTQPILATNLGGHAGILLVGGAEGLIYAFDALTGNAIWSRSLGSATITCPGVAPAALGVGGTAVYDPSTGNVFIGSNSNTVSNGTSEVWVNEMNALTGAMGGRANIAPSPLPGEVNFTHTSLTLANGLLYAGTGSTCDLSSWRGRVAAVNEGSMTLANTFYPAWNQAQAPFPAPTPLSGGGVWGWGGVSIGPAGDVWTGVGNVDTQLGSTGPLPPFAQDDNNEFDGFGEHVLQLTPNLSTVLQNNYPGFMFNNQQSHDLDISGTPVLGQPLGCHQMLGVQGKSGYLYLYDTTNIGQGPVNAFKFTSSSFNDPNLGNPAFSPLTGLFYASVSSAVAGGILPLPGMIAIKSCDSTSSIVWSAEFGPDSSIAGLPRSMPTVTAGGVVFVGTPCKGGASGVCTTTGKYGGALWALDATTGALLNGANPVITTPKEINMAPAVDGDWVFLFDAYGHLYGLTVDPNYPTIPNRFARTRSL